MAYVLYADVMVGLTVKKKVFLNKLLNKNNPITFTLRDLFETQRSVMTCGCGNVNFMMALDSEDFEEYLHRHKEFFAFQPDGSYQFLKENLYNPEMPDNIDYPSLLTVGIYNSATLSTFNYPLPREEKAMPSTPIIPKNDDGRSRG